MINKQTQTLLSKFSKIPLFSEHKAILIGGTALAYHLSHRESFDIDICFPFSDQLPKLDFLEAFEEVTVLNFDQGIIDTAINEGGDINEVMKRYIINGIKVDFVINPSSNIIESEILKNDSEHTLGHLRMSSIESIFKLKSLLLLDRNKIRDLYDVVYMMRECEFTAKDFIDTIMRYRITYLSQHILQLMEAKKEDPFDIEGIEKPSMKMKDYEVLKMYLVKKIREIV
ncbi:MAG: Nucleotidyl transferase AbiEii toxin, Type IV TA system [uncultured Sulfurovum sp.]|uniref:Nucleotidyl transferase AbiEii toxin, Type IV TA system n=1 Tax=uncultured Sulfurovum sp. TaxID=269237 RepID=A0A6S6U233_9BACT|nr:MAG: Nucleotidyl transferase AbiEii toxin, Type IV TA system [uncultured Sulfurovum sp.]